MASSSSALAGYKSPAVEDDAEKQNRGRKAALPSIPYGSLLSVLNDANLEDAFIAARPKLVDSWLKNELSSAKREDFESYREKLSSVVTFNRAHSGRPVGALWEKENRRITTLLDGWEPYL